MIVLTMPGGGGGGAVGTASAPTRDDKAMIPAVTAGDNQPTAVTISHVPANDSYVSVFVNGVMVEVGDADKTKDCYFSNDGGATARAIADIALGDELIWNGVISGYDLDASDEIDFVYNVLVP